MSYCGNRSLVKRQGALATVLPLRCRSWGCPKCAPRRRSRLIRECEAGEPNRFVTLTVSPHWFESPEDRGLKLSAAWRAYVRWYRKRWPKRGLEYLAVMELTGLGEPHLHILCRSGWIDFKELSSWMAEHMGAPHVYVEAIQRKTAVAKYVSKYISKRNIKLGTCKRYWRSIHYLPESNAARRKRLKGKSSFSIIDWSSTDYYRMVKHLCVIHPSDRDESFAILLVGPQQAPPFTSR